MPLQLAGDQDVVLPSAQTVNVGEHVVLKLVATPVGATVENPQWIITGQHQRDWITKDAEPVPMVVSDYESPEVHFLWRETTPLTAPNTVQVSALVDGVFETASIDFIVEQQLKPEKFYCDDLFMEYHNNWHSVYRFADASTRRGDLFLAWHRSQLEYFNIWRSYFGYGALPAWDPTTPWSGAVMHPSRQHPSTTTAPAAAFSQRHNITTLDLSLQGLDTPTAGEYDWRTQANGRGTNPEFVNAGYVLHTDTVGDVVGAPNIAFFSHSDVAALPSWHTAAGGTDADPWFGAGCPVNFDGSGGSTCAASTKQSLSDYTLRELGESIESGWYLDDFRINYHAFAHIAASEDMGNPVTSMRDPIFWAWHNHIDGILSAWQAVQTETGAVGRTFHLYMLPYFVDDTWETVRVPFQMRAIPEFIKPHHLTVNGSPATSVTDVSFTGTGYIFDFTGFNVPADGLVEVVIRREVDTHVRTSSLQPRPAVGMIMSIYGQVLTPHVGRTYYTK